MPSPKKKKPSPSKVTRQRATPKEAVTSILELMPDHPALAQLADPENEGRVWVVEYVDPPGVFMARSIPEPVDMQALDAEIRASFQALSTGEPRLSRYLLGLGWCGEHARRLVECLTEQVPRPEVPFSHLDLYQMEGIFRVVQ